MKILIVEDEFVSRKLMCHLLSGMGTVDVAVNGEEAIAAFRIALEESKPYECHEKVYNYYKTLINGDYYLGRFSIKKVTNYYGLIFGSHHPLGLEKLYSSGSY
jgi:hypothetical protein